MCMDSTRIRYRATLLLVALACAGISELPPAQETPRGVAAGLFDAALRDTLDTPPLGRQRSRTPVPAVPLVLLLGACGLLLALARRQRLRTGRGGGRPPILGTGQGEVAAEATRKAPSGSPEQTRAPIDLPPHVVAFLRRNAQRRREALERDQAADQERPDPLHDATEAEASARPQIDVWIPGYDAGTDAE